MAENVDLNTIEWTDPIQIGPTEMIFGAILIVMTRAMGDEGNSTRMIVAPSKNMDFVTLRGMIGQANDDVGEMIAGMIIPRGDEDDGV